MSNILELKDIYKEYDNGLIKALQGLSLQLESGKIYALMGPSGCGKSTLLNIIGTLDTPTRGTILYNNKELDNRADIHNFRRDFIGFVFQFHNLIPVLTLFENVESALISKQSISAKERRIRVEKLLDAMNILHRKDAFSTDISGGERQRGAIARALANNPTLLLADEPTGNVDSETVAVILKKLCEYVQGSDKSMLIATHDTSVSAIADVVIEMSDGKIIHIRDKKERE